MAVSRGEDQRGYRTDERERCVECLELVASRWGRDDDDDGVECVCIVTS